MKFIFVLLVAFSSISFASGKTLEKDTKSSSTKIEKSSANYEVGCAVYIVSDGKTRMYSGKIPENQCRELGETKVSETQKIDDLLTNFDSLSSNRFITKHGEKVLVYYYMEGYSCDFFQVKYIEKDRDTQIKTDIKTLMKIIGGGIVTLSNFSDSEQIPEEKFCSSEYVLQKDRATLELTISNIGDAELDVAKITDSILVGNTEHWYLSADMLVTRANQLKYDPDTKTLTESKKPNQFYIGANYSIGDILSNRRSNLDRLVVKMIVDMDKHPGDTWGIGIGYRPKQFDTVTISAIYTEFDEDQADGTIGKGQGVQLGVSFNLDKLTDWLKD